MPSTGHLFFLFFFVSNCGSVCLDGIRGRRQSSGEKRGEGVLLFIVSGAPSVFDPPAVFLSCS